MASGHEELLRRLARHREQERRRSPLAVLLVLGVFAAIVVVLGFVVVKAVAGVSFNGSAPMTIIFMVLVHLVLFAGALFLLFLLGSVLWTRIPVQGDDTLARQSEELRDRIQDVEEQIDETADRAEERKLEKEKQADERKLEALERERISFQDKARSRHERETLMRGIAIITGLLLYLGARAAGISVPELAYKAMSTSFPLAIALGGFVIPSLAGFVVSWFVIKHISGKDFERDVITMRVMSVILSLVFFVYCDSYVYTFSAGATTVQYLPNLVFSLSALLYAIFKYQPYAMK